MGCSSGDAIIHIWRLTKLGSTMRSRHFLPDGYGKALSLRGRLPIASYGRPQKYVTNDTDIEPDSYDHIPGVKRRSTTPTYWIHASHSDWTRPRKDGFASIPLSTTGTATVLVIEAIIKLAEARRLKAGRWRIYDGPELPPRRDPATGVMATFESLGAAQRWWDGIRLGEPPLAEALKCATCGGYFGQKARCMSYQGSYYHHQHAPNTMAIQRRRLQA
jgi:hypothetical protein